MASEVTIAYGIWNSRSVPPAAVVVCGDVHRKHFAFATVTLGKCHPLGRVAGSVALPAGDRGDPAGLRFSGCLPRMGRRGRWGVTPADLLRCAPLPCPALPVPVRWRSGTRLFRSCGVGYAVRLVLELACVLANRVDGLMRSKGA